MLENIYADYQKSLLQGSSRKCFQTIQHLLDEGWPILRIYEDWFTPSLKEVGEMWEHNKISVAVEHLATATTEHMMNMLGPHIFTADLNGKKALVSCTENELHQIGARMVADIFTLHGWDALFLGANTPKRDLIDMVESHQPSVVALSFNIFFNASTFLSTLDELLESDKPLDIIVGGQALKGGSQNMLHDRPSVVHMKSIGALQEYLESQAS
ncbi:MAG: cobalamin-dependent protein [Planctomycetes bacterium]|nr:cobalamin-dependent protein [Planctomycetota bacterium]